MKVLSRGNNWPAKIGLKKTFALIAFFKCRNKQFFFKRKKKRVCSGRPKMFWAFEVKGNKLFIVHWTMVGGGDKILKRYHRAYFYLFIICVPFFSFIVCVCCHQEGGWSSSSMNRRCGWIWVSAHEAIMHPEVYKHRWQVK